MTAPQIPGFTYVQPLGSGGFADVHLYEQQWPKQRVAIKIVRPDISFTAREKELFRSEADAMAHLADHPYIVNVLNAGEVEGRPYLVMRFCPPPDLGVRVRTAPMSVVDVLATGVKLASAVETAHRSGILHRDIKPSNVLVTTYQEPALTDFGIAGRIAEVHADTEVRMSYPWAPPEMIDGRSNGTVASDVYSLGATLWNLLVGRSPYSVPHGDNSSRALATRILHTPAPATQRPDVPPALERLLAQCLAKQPDQRPRSALELARSLQQIESSMGYARTPLAVEESRGFAAPAAEDNPEDATVFKPSTFVQGSGSVTGSGAAPADGDLEEPPRSSRGVLWAALGVVAALALLVTLVVRGGDESEEPTEETTPSSALTTPGSPLADPAPPPAPEISVATVPRGYRFTWSPAETPLADDTYQWTDPSTQESQRTRATSVVRPAEGRVCLRVVVVRVGAGTSPPAEACAGSR
ncbi:serine/threonine-protein kinase [Nocardioides insulae]|uniref:serine/threonine-protein kinase n=1 Tax=Nocardioides insulae TaxID=394734 RepID=UPI0003FCF899|nr:serine/threonine-protein kinase [Nocardioides insulae]